MLNEIRHPTGRRAMSSCPCQRVFRRCRRDQAAPRVHDAFWRACPHPTQALFGSYLSAIRNPHSEPLNLETPTRLDWQRFSRSSVVGDSRRPQTPVPGLTPAQTRARGQDLMDSNSARAGLHAAAPFPVAGKDSAGK